jgi:transcriptional regulator with XRE-family HTH domain
MIVNTKLSSWLQGELDRIGWSQSELARRSGTSSPTVSRILNGDLDPTWHFCYAIAKPLGRTPAELFVLAGLLNRREAKIDETWLEEAISRPAAEGLFSAEMSLQALTEALRELDPDARREILHYTLWHRERQTGSNKFSGKSPATGGSE